MLSGGWDPLLCYWSLGTPTQRLDPLLQCRAQPRSLSNLLCLITRQCTLMGSLTLIITKQSLKIFVFSLHLNLYSTNKSRVVLIISFKIFSKRSPGKGATSKVAATSEHNHQNFTEKSDLPAKSSSSASASHSAEKNTKPKIEPAQNNPNESSTDNCVRIGKNRLVCVIYIFKNL